MQHCGQQLFPTPRNSLPKNIIKAETLKKNVKKIWQKIEIFAKKYIGRKVLKARFNFFVNELKLYHLYQYEVYVRKLI